MKQHELKPSKGAKRSRKRVGRGDGSGHGSYSGKGLKGQNSRSGGGVRPGFEGGQLPITKALPHMRGFTNIFRTEYVPVNIDRLSVFHPETEVTMQQLVDAGIVKSLRRPVKILGRGELGHALIVEAHRFSAAARRKIEAAGGRIKEIR